MALLAVPLAYLLGAIPLGLVVAKLAGGVDIRQYGSGRTGMTNVLRTVGMLPATVVLAGDLGKGAGAVALARLLTDSQGAEVAAALAALLGHNWSVFIRFRGGRGTAPGWGAVSVMVWPASIAAIVVGLPAIAAFRYVSLGSVLAISTAMVATVVLVALDYTPVIYLAYLFTAGPIILWQHRENIQRLLRGTERRIGQPSNSLDSAPGAQREER